MGSESRHDHGSGGSTNRPDILRRLPGIRQFISLLSFEIHQHNLGCPFPAVSVLSIYSLHKIPTVMIESADKLHAIHFEVFGTRPDSDLDAVWPSSSVTRHTCTWSRNFFVLDIIVATENELSEQVIISLLDQSARSYKVHSRLRKQGFGYLKEKVHSLNELAERIPLILLIDLDQSECLLEFKREWLPVHQSPNLLLRIAVREVESRLPADRTALAQFLRISEAQIPREPDKLPYPKQSLPGLFKLSPKRTLREDVLPKAHSTSVVGLGYNDVLRRFVAEYWSSERAIMHSPSLNHTWDRIRNFRPKGGGNSATEFRQ